MLPHRTNWCTRDARQCHAPIRLYLDSLTKAVMPAAGSRLFSRPVDVVLPNRSKEQAIDIFHAFQHSLIIAPRHVLTRDPDASIKLVLCPFWAFKVSASASYLAEVEPDATSSQPVEQWDSKEEVLMHPWDQEMLVPASYSIRRNLLEGLKSVPCSVPASSSPTGAASDSQPQLCVQTATLPIDEGLLATIADLAGVTREEVDVQDFEMRQSIAWQLALRSLRHRQVRVDAMHCKTCDNSHALQILGVCELRMLRCVHTKNSSGCQTQN
jgi:hypothetical protein